MAALSMVDYPHLASRAREAPLPKGITFLLQVVTQDSDAMQEACLLTGQTEKHIRKAAAFFVEQVLLSQPADCYRVLGCNCRSSNTELRRHMALIMKWLHPDVASDTSPAFGFDRSLYANRVIEAWEALKTDDRRATYDEARARQIKGWTLPSNGRATRSLPKPTFSKAAFSEARIKIIPYRVPMKPVGFWTRVFSIFVGRL